MRAISILLLFAAIWGFSGCATLMIGHNKYDKDATKMPTKGQGGFLNGDGSKYYWGEIKIITKPAGLEVELYNRGEPAKQRYYGREVTETETEYHDNDGLGYTACMQAYANIGVSISGAECEYKAITQEVTRTKLYTFDEGLRHGTTPTTAKLYARTPENKASKYLLIFKKGGKEVARREVKAHINWWVWGDHITPPVLGTFWFFTRGVMGWHRHPQDVQERSYLTQGDIEIDLTKEVQALER